MRYPELTISVLRNPLGSQYLSLQGDVAVAHYANCLKREPQKLSRYSRTLR